VLIALKVSIPLDTEAELSGKIMRRRPKKGVQTLPSSLAVLGIIYYIPSRVYTKCGCACSMVSSQKPATQGRGAFVKRQRARRGRA
jgi:hypothetical protein